MMPTNTPTPKPRTKMPLWGWIALAVAGIGVVMKLPVLAILISLAVLGVAVYALVKKTPTFFKFAGPSRAIMTSAGAVLALFVSAGVAAQSAPPVTSAEPASFANVITTGAPTAKPTPKPASAPIATKTPKPSPSVAPTKEQPAPVVTTVTEVKAIPFGQQRWDDPNTPQGTEFVSAAGANGELTITYEVTTVDGVETSRKTISEVVTVAPVDEHIGVGTFVEPVQFAAPVTEPEPATNGCDPNYADACVPIDSDVDCAGGSGNGPSYLEGTARVVGSDIYDLDRDNDGIACN